MRTGMEALFPEWSNTAIRVALGFLVALLVGLPTALMVYMRTPFAEDALYPVDQPVEFDHRHHVRDDGIECRFCHAGAERSAYAGLPSTAVCMGCHAQVWNDSPMLEPVRRAWFSGEAIPWNRVHDLPDFVYFDHSVHVTKGIGCESCHGRVDLMARVEQSKPLTMGWCLSCHRDPTPNLRPPEAITQMGWTQASGEGARLEQRYGTRRLTHCTTCHR
jgi:hypothetical protein